MEWPYILEVSFMIVSSRVALSMPPTTNHRLGPLEAMGSMIPDRGSD